MRGKRDKMASEQVGIEGMHFQLQEGWLPARIEKLKDSLTLEVEDERGALRMIVKTSHVGDKAVNTSKALKGLRRRLGKKAEFNTKPGVAGLSKRLKRFEGFTPFSFREPGGHAGCGFLAKRKERGEALLAVGFQHDDPDLTKAVSVLTSFNEDRYDDDQVWEFQGLRISLPSSFHFASYKYDRRGYMRLVLKDARAELALERFSGAEMILAGKGNLSHMWLEAAKKDIGRFDLFKEREINYPHHGISFRRDTESGIFKRGKAALRALLPFGKAYFLAGFLWHCEESNRIIGLKAAGRKPDQARLAEKFLDRVACCAKTGLPK